MAFSEAVKLEVKKRAHFRCCMCREPDIEVHHIVPQSEGGNDTLDNAAPLCARCHDVWGGNPQKRKLIRQARDAWYEVCESRYTVDPEWTNTIESRLKELESKLELGAAVPGTPSSFLIDSLRTSTEQQATDLDLGALAGSEAIRYVIYGVGQQQDNWFLVDLAAAFGAQTLEGVPLVVDTGQPVAQVCFRSWAEALEVFQTVAKAAQATRTSVGSDGNAFLQALLREFTPQLVKYVVAAADRESLLKSPTTVAPDYVVFGIEAKYAQVFQAANVVLEQIKGRFTLDPHSKAVLFRDLRGLAAWANAVQKASRYAKDRRKVLEIVVESVFRFAAETAFGHGETDAALRSR